MHSFEFHEERFEKAKVEFEKHGLDGIVKVKHQDVYKMGFELIDEVDSGSSISPIRIFGLPGH